LARKTTYSSEIQKRPPASKFVKKGSHAATIVGGMDLPPPAQAAPRPRGKAL
jgi:hypothetical protein